MFPKASCAFPTFCHPRMWWWMYICLLAVDYRQFPVVVESSRSGKLRSHFKGVLSRARAGYSLEALSGCLPGVEGSLKDAGAAQLICVKPRNPTSEHTDRLSLTESSIENEDTADLQHLDLSEEEQQQCAAMQAGIMSLRSWLSRRGIVSAEDEEKVDSCAESNVQGLDAVVHFFQFVPVKPGDYSVQSALFPEDEPVTMVSALTDRRARYRSTKDMHASTVEDDEGRSFSIRIRRRKYSVTPLVVAKTLTKLETYLTLHTVFDMKSLHDVECEFRILALKDILVFQEQSGTHGCLRTPEGYLLNYFLLYSPQKANLLSLVTTIEAEKNSSAETERLAQIARLNLSLQIIKLVGNVRRKRVLLPRLTLQHFRLSSSGTVYFLPLKPPRIEKAALQPRYNKSSPAKRTAAVAPFDPRTNALDTSVVLLYVWCPSEAKASSLSIETATKRKVLEATMYPRCYNMPETLRQLIRELFFGGMDVAEAMESSSYASVEAILKNL